MRIAVIEHRLRGDALADADALVEASKKAADGGAEVVVFPHALPIDEAEAHERLTRGMYGVPGTRLVPRIAANVRAQVFPVTDQVPVLGERLGPIALLHGDACINPSVLERTAAASPNVLIMTPCSESDLQAEAMLELALALSESAAGLVVIAETVGAEMGDAGHGGSAIVLLGEVLAESLGSDGDVLFADLPEPMPRPEPPEPLPEMPTILEQRLANHEGRKLDMGYLADLSDGGGAR